MVSTAAYNLQRSPPSSGSAAAQAQGCVYDSSSLSSLATPTVLLLSGWTPGPITYLRTRIQTDLECNIVEPRLLMPPWYGFWCWDLNFILMLGVVGFLLGGLYKVLFEFQSFGYHGQGDGRVRQIIYFSVLFGILCCWIRLMVAVVCRSAQKDGVEKCLREMRRKNVILCVGFSWGAGVLSELLTRDDTGLDSQPAFLLIAPVSAAAGMAAMRLDAAERLHELENNNFVHVVHASDDPIFCPHPERWEQVAGVKNVSFCVLIITFIIIIIIKMICIQLTLAFYVMNIVLK